MKYHYVLVVSGEVEGRDVEHAKLQVEMGYALMGRLLKTDHEISIRVLPKVGPDNGFFRIPDEVMEDG